MNENIQIMLQKLSDDEETLKKLTAIHDPEEAYALVSSLQGGYTREEFIEAMNAFSEQLNADLNSGDLAKAAGGVEASDVASAVSAAASLSAVSGAVSGSVLASVSAVVSGVSAAATMGAASLGAATAVLGGAASAAA